jgi:hypothetical protein
MATTRKYVGPCPDHPGYVHDCNHCKALRERERARRVALEPEVPIYLELHWPRPAMSRDLPQVDSGVPAPS